MMTHAIAFELSRQRLADVERRATLAARLGTLPKPPMPPLFRREAKPLTCVVEVHRNGERERIHRRLVELAASRPHGQRRAS